MYSISDIASAFGLKMTTLRYWINKNNRDCEIGIYDYNLSNLIKTMNIFKKTASKNNIGRHYKQLIILDLEEFKNEFFKYIEFKETNKKRKKYKDLYWTNSAIDCYNSQMECTKCFNRDICKSIISDNTEPPMKKIVRNLLEKIGKPPKTITTIFII